VNRKAKNIGDKPKIIVVDDDPLILEAVSALLNEYGYVSFPCENASNAFEYLKAGDADVVLTDISMPGMTGLELLDKTKALYPQVPVILMTAYSETLSITPSRDDGAFDFIKKPFSPDILVSAVKKAVEYTESFMTELKQVRPS